MKMEVAKGQTPSHASIIGLSKMAGECSYPAEFRESASWVSRICELPADHGGNHFTPAQEPTPFAELLRNARASRKLETAEAEANLRPAEITVPGHEVDIASTSARTGVGQISRLARDNGWETKVGRSEAFSGDHLQKNGIVKPGKTETHEWVEAVKTPHHFTYSLTDIRLDGRVATKDELKEAITNADE